MKPSATSDEKLDIGEASAYCSKSSRIDRTILDSDASEVTRRRPRVLFIGGSMNQTTQVYQVAMQMPDVDAWFSPHYATGFEEWLRKLHLAEFTVLGQKHVNRSLRFFHERRLQVDYGGTCNDYDLVVTSSDLVVQENIRHQPVVLIQEGMTDPETWLFRLAIRVPFVPRWVAGTATNGLSDQYSCFCVASKGYRDLFIRKGVKADKIRVTGIPNFDHCRKYCENEFPHRGYVLVCTSDLREKYRFENRAALIRRAVDIAGGRRLIFKLHPNENVRRAALEIRRLAPHALVYSSGSAEEMIANCDVFITRYSSTVYVALALRKEVHCDLDQEELRNLVPDQHGQAAENIAAVCRELLATCHI